MTSYAGVMGSIWSGRLVTRINFSVMIMTVSAMQAEETSEEAARPASVVEGSWNPYVRTTGMWDDGIGVYGFMGSRNYNAFGLFSKAVGEMRSNPALGIEMLRCVRTHWPAEIETFSAMEIDYATNRNFHSHTHCTLAGLFAVDWDAPCSTSARSGVEHRTTVNLHPYHALAQTVGWNQAEDLLRCRKCGCQMHVDVAADLNVNECHCAECHRRSFRLTVHDALVRACCLTN